MLSLKPIKDYKVEFARLLQQDGGYFKIQGALNERAFCEWFGYMCKDSKSILVAYLNGLKRKTLKANELRMEKA